MDEIFVLFIGIVVDFEDVWFDGGYEWVVVF